MVKMNARVSVFVYRASNRLEPRSGRNEVSDSKLKRMIKLVAAVMNGWLLRALRPSKVVRSNTEPANSL